MSSVACGEPLSLAQIPLRRVVRLDGITAEQLAVDLDPLPDGRCAFEIGGPDHRGSLKYAADRRRDNGLTLDGFAVLRITNEEILDDPLRGLTVIENLPSTKRHDEGNPT